MMVNDTSLFLKQCKELDLDLNETQINQFLTYYSLLVEWNSFMNLTAITDFDEVVTKHFVDSVAICKYYKKIHKSKIIDVGTGAGFPGIPLKIINPDSEITLLDSLNKRVNFLNEVINKLNLSGIKAIHGRAEDFANRADYREQYDICVSRAVANLSTLSELCIPFVKEGGYFISYKSEKAKEELVGAKNAIDTLGAQFEKQICFSLPCSNMNRNLLIIRKVAKTPKKYPRKAGTPSKNPIV